MGCLISKKYYNLREEILKKDDEILNLKYEIKIYKKQINETKFFFQKILRQNNIDFEYT